jgi:hypothetical protein
VSGIAQVLPPARIVQPEAEIVPVVPVFALAPVAVNVLEALVLAPFAPVQFNVYVNVPPEPVVLTMSGEPPEVIPTEGLLPMFISQLVVLIELHVKETFVPAVTVRLPLVPLSEKFVIVGAPVFVLPPLAHTPLLQLVPVAQAIIADAGAELMGFDVPWL